MAATSEQLERRTKLCAPISERPAKAKWWLPALLLVIYAVQCLYFVATQSLTFDEPIHLLTGVEGWHGRFNVWNDHPPLARMLFALPLLGHHFELQYTGKSPGEIQVHGMKPGPVEVAWRTRPVNVLLGIVLGTLLWATARNLFSPNAANVALALFAVSPGMIAHFSVATTDGAGILMIFASAVQVLRWRRQPSVANTLLLGVVSGGLLLAKFYTLPIFCLTVLLVLMLKAGAVAWRPRDWNWRPASLVVFLASTLLCGAYGFHVTHLRFHDRVMTAFIPGRELPIVTAVPVPGSFTVPVLGGEYGDGLRYVQAHNRIGHPNYLFGNISRTGWWYYYPAVIALKWPIVILVFSIAGWVLIARHKPVASELKILAMFPLVFAAMLPGSRIQIGDRHALPLYPFLLIGAAALWERINSHQWAKPLLLALLALQTADVLRFAPDYLSYTNPWVRPAEAYRCVSDSNLDWGEGLIALREWQQQHPRETLYLAAFGSVDAGLYGIRSIPLPPGERVTGTVAVQFSALTGQYLKSPPNYRWLLDEGSREMLNHSMFIVRAGQRETATR